MPAIKDQAIVLRRLDYSETSQVLVFLTRLHGQQRLIGKGLKRSTKKKFSVGIDLLERGHVVFLFSTRQEGKLGTLTEWFQDEAHLGLRGDLGCWYAAQYAAEITAAMTEEADPHPDLFDALSELLRSLCEDGDTRTRVIHYQRALLRSVGLWPNLTQCVVCGRQAPPHRAAYYSAQQGGLVCRRCQPTQLETRTVPAAVLTALREDDLTDSTSKAVLELLDYTISQILAVSYTHLTLPTN